MCNIFLQTVPNYSIFKRLRYNLILDVFFNINTTMSLSPIQIVRVDDTTYGLKGKTFDVKENIKQVTRNWHKKTSTWILPSEWSYEQCLKFASELNNLLVNPQLFQKVETSSNNSSQPSNSVSKHTNAKQLLYSQRSDQYKKIHFSAEFPIFFPLNGVCWNCSRQIFEILDPGQNSEPITGCPYCHKSYVE